MHRALAVIVSGLGGASSPRINTWFSSMRLPSYGRLRRTAGPPVEETVQSFEALVDGELDEVPEQAFFNVGGVESVLAKAKTLQES